MHRRLGSATAVAGFFRGKQPEFAMGEISLEQYNCFQKMIIKEGQSFIRVVLHHGFHNSGSSSSSSSGSKL